MRSGTLRERMLEALRRLADIIKSPPLPQPICREPDVDTVLATAIAGQADLFISGDNDLLSLKQFQNISIVSPANTLEFIETKK